MEGLTFQVGIPPEVEELTFLRETVGWDPGRNDYPIAFTAYATCVTAHTADARLVGWCAALSDGVRHGFLLDVIVHPMWQRHGVGRQLVERAVAALGEQGITIVHVDYVEEHKAFYERCGFRATHAGIRELHRPEV